MKTREQRLPYVNNRITQLLLEWFKVNETPWFKGKEARLEELRAEIDAEFREEGGDY